MVLDTTTMPISPRISRHASSSCLKLPHAVIRQPDALPIAAVGAVEYEDAVSHGKSPLPAILVDGGGEDLLIPAESWQPCGPRKIRGGPPPVRVLDRSP